MLGRGFYNRHSAPQWAVIDHVLPWLEDALVSMNLPLAPDTIALADFGCSEGKNSIAVCPTGDGRSVGFLNGAGG
jgi:cyclopropane-fatty-acyl-phospholipid synthase